MPYNFDTIINREGTNCLKYDFSLLGSQTRKDILPMWVADMDFQAPPCVGKALEKRVQHGIFGYTDTGESYTMAVQNWFTKRFAWSTKEEWVVQTPGVVDALYSAVRVLTESDDAVLIQQPVYGPLATAVRDNGRKLVVNQLVYENGEYCIDFDALEQQIIQNKVKLFMLCSPHNPVGRVWKREELISMGEICLRHGVFVVADEIHADFVYPGHTHTVFASLSEEFANHSIICTAPSKTFNLAGLQLSNIFIPNPTIRKRFLQDRRQTGSSLPNVMGLLACEAAYAEGADWLDELKLYLAGNIEWVKRFLNENLPEIKLIEPQGTYLLWLDWSKIELQPEKRKTFLLQEAGVWLNSGTAYGAGGEAFERMNIACPRKIVQTALRRIEFAIQTKKIK